MIEKYFHFLGGSRNIHHIIFIQDTSEGKAFLAQVFQSMLDPRTRLHVGGMKAYMLLGAFVLMYIYASSNALAENLIHTDTHTHRRNQGFERPFRCLDRMDCIICIICNAYIPCCTYKATSRTDTSS